MGKVLFILNWAPSDRGHSQNSTAESPTTPTTAISVSARDVTYVGGNKAGSTHKGSLTRGASVDLARAAAIPAATTIVTPSTAATMVTGSPSENRIETVADTASVNHVNSATTVISPGAVLTESQASASSQRQRFLKEGNTGPVLAP